MKQLLLFSLACAVPCALFFIIFFPENNDVQHSQPFTIVCTTSIITDAVKKIGGDTVTVVGLMGPGVDPHLYRAREGDAHKLAAADLIFYHGLHLEGKMVHLLAHMPNNIVTVAVTDALDRADLIGSDEFPDVYDPHVWFDVQLWIQIVNYISAAMQQHNPQNAHHYQINTVKFITELEQLNTEIRAEISTIPAANRTLVTAHDAFAYFGRAYNFSVIGLQGISTDAEPGAADIQNLANVIVANKIHTIFIEHSIPPRTMQAVHYAVKAQNWSIQLGDELYSDALGAPEEETGTYCGMVQYNLEALVRGLC
jgi:manganese/zinc/iron transport system substrate-binding protein